MRLYNIYYLCKVSVDGIRSLNCLQNTYSNGKTDYTLENWEDALNSYNLIREIAFLRDDVKIILNQIPAHEFSEKRPNISNVAVANIKNRNIKLLAKLDAIIEFMNH